MGRYLLPGRHSVLIPIAAGYLIASFLTVVASLRYDHGEDGGSFAALLGRFKPVLAGIALGLLVLAAVRSGTAAEEVVWFGLPEERIVVLEGYACEDGFRSFRGSVLVSARLRRCGARDGTETDAGGRVTLILGDAETIPARGSRIEILVTIMADEEGLLLVGSAVDALNSDWKNTVSRVRYRVFTGIEKKIDRLSSDSASLLKALLLGIREDLGLRERELFRRAGCMHVLALSGMHLGVITGIALGIFGILGRRKLAAAGAGCVVVGYLFLAGCRPSLLRAAVMVLVGTAAVVTGRKVEGRLVLGTSFLVVCAVMPWSMESLSFTLSFAAVAGIVLTADRFDGFLKRYLPSGVSGALAVSLASQLFTAPILIRSFGTLYPGGLIAAIPVGILAAIYLGMGLLFVMIPGPTGLAAWRCGFDIVHRGMIECTDIASRIPGIRCPPIPSLLIWGGTAAAVLALIYGGDLRVRIERIGRSAQVSIQRPKIGGRGAHKKGIGSDQEVRAKFSRR